MSHRTKGFVRKIALIVTVALFVLSSVSGCSKSRNESIRRVVLPDINTTGSLDYEPYFGDRVSIPSVTGLCFSYGESTQIVQFENPATNRCLLRVSIYLSDGKLVFISEPIQPGDVLNEIQPLITLTPGVYKHSVLVFDCLSETDPHNPLTRCEFEIEISVYEGAKG